jgi:methylmalonyl-CoA mutase cobalamin-binding subunit
MDAVVKVIDDPTVQAREKAARAAASANEVIAAVNALVQCYAHTLVVIRDNAEALGMREENLFCAPKPEEPVHEEQAVG